MYARLVLGTFLTLLIVPSNASALCSDNGETVVYINGILTSLVDAQNDLFKLQTKFVEKTEDRTVVFKNGYNASHLGGGGDFLQSVAQTLGASVSDFDRDTILRQIHPQVTTRRILLVGHSQGTFYTNELHSYLTSHGVPQSSIAVYNLATPASFVAGGGNYLTSANDKLINAVREYDARFGAPAPLSANIKIPLPPEEEKDSWGGHHFTTSYLDSAPVRIVSDITNALKTLKTSDTASTNGCFTPPPTTLAYRAEAAMFSVADPAAQSARDGAVAASNATSIAVQTAQTTALAAIERAQSALVAALRTLQSHASASSQGAAATVALAVEAPVQSERDAVSTADEVLVVEEKPQSIPTIQKTMLTPEPKITSLPSKPAPNPVPQQSLNPVAPGFGGGGPAPVPETLTSDDNQQAASADLTLGVTSPTDNAFSATTSVAFSGTTTPSALISASFMTTTAATTADGAGDWSITIILPEGSTTVSFIASDDSGNTSATTTRTITVDLTPPAAPSASIDECNFSLATSTCLVAAAAATVSWSAVADSSYYGLFKNSVLTATTTATSTTANITDNATTTFAVVAYDAAGNAATSTPQEVFATSQPLILNEVAWMGTTASADDEWIEIKNNTPYTLGLSRAAIVSADGTRYIPLSGTIAPLISSAQPDSVPPVSSSEMLDGFYTIERRPEAVNFTTHGTSTSFALLSDSGEELKLVVGTGADTTTVDTTPAVATCGGWCAGSTHFPLGSTLSNGTTTAVVTMERVENSADGSLASSWQNNDYYWRTSSDASGNQIYGTPGWKNSSGLSAAGWFCSPDKTPLIPNASYTPRSSDCTYLSRFIFSDNGRRDGGVYRGTPGSATAVSTGHLFGGGTAARIAEDASSILASPGSDPSATGQQFFTAIWETRTGPAFTAPNDDSTNFDLYLRTGVNLAGDVAAPHDDYRVIPWVYGP